MRLIFMGTPEFAVPTLVEIVGRGHEVVAVYTAAAKPAGRGMEQKPSGVEREARRFGLAVFTPATLGTAEAKAFRDHGAEAAIVVAYGKILPKTVLEAAPCSSSRSPRPGSRSPRKSTIARPASIGCARGRPCTIIAAGCRRFRAPGSSFRMPARRCAQKCCARRAAKARARPGPC